MPLVSIPDITALDTDDKSAIVKENLTNEAQSMKSKRSGSGRKKWKENFVVIALPTFIGYLFGAGATEILTMVGKYNAGRLRPHFFSVCKPGNYSTNVDLEYIEEYDCGGNSIQFPVSHILNLRK